MTMYRRPKQCVISLSFIVDNHTHQLMGLPGITGVTFNVCFYVKSLFSTCLDPCNTIQFAEQKNKHQMNEMNEILPRLPTTSKNEKKLV